MDPRLTWLFAASATMHAPILIRVSIFNLKCAKRAVMLISFRSKRYQLTDKVSSLQKVTNYVKFKIIKFHVSYSSFIQVFKFHSQVVPETFSTCR